MNRASLRRRATGSTIAGAALLALSPLSAASAGSGAQRAVLSTPPPFVINTWRGDARDV